MSDLLDPPRTRVLIAPCGCVAALDATDGQPGFCRTRSEAAEDTRDGFTETIVDHAATPPLGCDHDPQWGREKFW